MVAPLTPPLRPLSSPQRRVLLTGFDPFDGARINSSWQAVATIDGDIIAGHTIVAALLPTAFDASLAVLSKLLRLHKPALVICIGQAGGRSALSLERVALNIRDARIPDNAGNQPVDVPVIKSGPAAYFSTLPVKAMRQALNDAGIAAEVSQTAGTFVCNHVFYALMHKLRSRVQSPSVRGGFIHVPYLPEQGSPSMPLDEMVRGIRIAVACALATTNDLKESAGSLG